MNKWIASLAGLFGKTRADAMLDIAELKRRVDSGHGLVLDVRPAIDFSGADGHIAQALNIPVEELDGRLAELGQDRTRPIAVVCRTDKRSAQAVQLLAARGYSNARAVRGGMTAWRAQRWPLRTTTAAGA